MTRIVLLGFIVWASTVGVQAQDIYSMLASRPARTELRTMLSPASRPETFTASHPASFFTIDENLFAQARELADNIPFTLKLDLPGVGVVEAVVARYRVIDESSQLMAMTATGPVKIPAPQSVLVRGFVPSIKGSFVVAAIYSDWATGMVTTGPADGERTFLMSPLSIDAPRSTMVVYDQSQVPARNEWSCHTKDPEMGPIGARSTKKGENEQVRYRQIKIALECDEPYYIDHGRDLNKATRYAESVVAASSAIYERDVTATLLIGQITIWTTVDPYPGTNTSTLLGQFATRWVNTFPNVDRTLAHLLSGINGIGGVAYLETLCNKQYGYAVSGLNNNITYPAAGYVWDTDVFSHETGHNVGSPHTFNCGWNPPIDSCVAAEGGTCYTGTKAVKGTIMSYCHLTAQGTNLNFHQRVRDYMKTKLVNDWCTPLTYELKVTIPDTIWSCRNGVKSVTATATAGAEPYTYRWYSSYFDTTTTTNSFMIKQPRNFTFFVNVRDAVGNSATDTCVMKVFEAPEANLVTAATKVCSGKSADVLCEVTGGKPPYKYQWLRNGVLISNITELYSQRIDEPTRFAVIVSDSNACSDTAYLEIKTYDLQMMMAPSTLAIPPMPPCKNTFLQEYTLTNIGADSLEIDSITTGASVKVTAPLPIRIAPGISVKVPVTVTVRGTGMVREDIVFLDKTCRWRFRGTISGLRTVPKIFTTLPYDLGTKILCDSVTPRMVVVGFSNPTSFPMTFSDVYTKSLKNTIAFERAPFVVPPGGERSALMYLTTTLSTGTFSDTLTMTYESDGCEGSFTVPIVLRNALAKITQPAVVTFDTVRTSSKPIVRQLPVTATLTGTPSATVQLVEITEPFTTSMKQGLVLPNAKATNVTVTLDPKDITTGGLIKGTLRYQIDSCAVPYEVQLNANIVVVGVDDEQGANQARISISDDGIVVSDAPGRVDVFDLRGQLVASAGANNGYHRFGGLASGCYLVSLHDEASSRIRTVITCLVR
jgi:hypothetical protein